ncbi:MAG: restriction endonuclease, partial [Paraprevotella sp.]|nr:restriction endonuclease [Paraprevotella sp.]
KTQYEKLFYNQQSSMTAVDYSSYAKKSEPIEIKRVEIKRSNTEIKPVQHQLKIAPIPTHTSFNPIPPSSQVGEKEILKTKLEELSTESIILHKKFGRGEIIKINKNEKFIHIKFGIGEKKFVFPDAFLMGFLEIE